MITRISGKAINDNDNTLDKNSAKNLKLIDLCETLGGLNNQQGGAFT